MASSKDRRADGQSDTAKAWVARRAAVDTAVRAVEDEGAERRRRMPAPIQSSGGNPAPFLIGIVLLTLALVLFGWFFLDRMQCDPVFMDRGLTSACR
jgi:hypothetical protein